MQRPFAQVDVFTTTPYAGNPVAVVLDGSDVSDEEMQRRQKDRPVQEPRAARGYLKLFLENVTQADKGVDFGFLRKG